ncbi:hypothetical protein [Stenotrophomonas sp. PS02289]|uniref:hypothetical protein n=1 Tax=Stenotrophomonas sp. PS02289 TaxID=2991422 RepID=UPI00249B6D64|nr:hypothetical protein [Stenotrophomonas sp. PS02289]
MNIESVNVCGVSGMADGVLSATITNNWFNAERTAHIVEVARRVERQHRKTSRRLADVCADLDASLRGHPLEQRLRARLLSPLERDCQELATVAARVNVRLALFAPAQSQERFEQGIDLQLADIRAEQEAVAAAPAASNGPTMPHGYWISEDCLNRIERARSAALLLSCLDERIGVSLEAVAAGIAYLHDDLAAVVDNAKHSSELGGDDEAS